MSKTNLHSAGYRGHSGPISRQVGNEPDSHLVGGDRGLPEANVGIAVDGLDVEVRGRAPPGFVHVPRNTAKDWVLQN